MAERRPTTGRLAAALGLGLIFALAPRAWGQEFRTWTDGTGRHRVEAKFVSLTDGKVTLERMDGSAVEIELERLSEADRKAAAEFARNEGADSPFKPVSGDLFKAKAPVREGRAGNAAGIEGHWRLVGIRSAGRDVHVMRPDLAPACVFLNGRIIYKITLPDGRIEISALRYGVVPARSPGEIDFLDMANLGDLVAPSPDLPPGTILTATIRGIYRIDGDTLQICRPTLNAVKGAIGVLPPPPSFTGESPDLELWTFKRDGPGAPVRTGPAEPKAADTLKDLQGTWRPRSGLRTEPGGQDRPIDPGFEEVEIVGDVATVKSGPRRQRLRIRAELMPPVSVPVIQAAPIAGLKSVDLVQEEDPAGLIPCILEGSGIYAVEGESLSLWIGNAGGRPRGEGNRIKGVGGLPGLSGAPSTVLFLQRRKPDAK